jgi:hypothetical protein
MKVCTRCHSQKPLSEFSKDRRRRDGLRQYCKECGVAYSTGWEAKNRDRRNAYRRANPAPSNRGDARYGYHLQARYGLTLDDYADMAEAQDHRCAICGEAGVRRLAVDHSHSTQKVRGLLCDKCNLALGLFRDSPRIMKRAIDYVGTPPQT